MKNEFKVGDRVRIREWEDMEKEFDHTRTCIRCFGDFTQSMKHLCGRTATITDINGEYVHLEFDNESGDIDWTYSTDMIESLLPNEKITIERNDNEVIARWGKKVGIAKCNPEDKFDFATGASLAFERLMRPAETKSDDLTDCSTSHKHSANNCTAPTHRCAGSLKNEASIRYGNDIKGWLFSILAYDSEYDTRYLRFVSAISHCPYCGKELTVGDKETGE